MIHSSSSSSSSTVVLVASSSRSAWGGGGNMYSTMIVWGVLVPMIVVYTIMILHSYILLFLIISCYFVVD